ncbi:hypothetical protein GCM10011385_32370 [Nitratireductor aestuarii]|uniref:Bacteriophage phiJL001 Gp84 C-terminal domain-containing protein n=1 Tax=Nitratireductor aestuarii TaxID=1735103 RepID=A0A916W8G9_9HYPH|nr:DUF2163 domain-containing protein [Nitratireductor aestuarii]GGA75863.1 hypothetical protein GCM10011385_32370 [Nitratireductor aestuarii]
MAALSEQFAAHLTGEITTVCHCWRLTRRDGTALGFTDHDRAIECDDTLFQPESGLSATEARRSLGMAVDAVDVEGVLSSMAIEEEEIAAGFYDGATVETLLVNWRDPDQFARIGRSVIGKITRQDGRFVAELESPERALDQTNGRTLRRTCDAELGDARCGVDLDTSAYKGEGIIEAIRDHAVLVSGLEGFENGWFSHGVLTWTSGERSGRPERVIAHRIEAGLARLDLRGPLEIPAQEGDGFTITAGCDKRFATCKAKFSNSVNFRGFPHLPGNDFAYTYVSEGQVFDGGALVK